ncbi:phenylalanine--tRNA ligase subunit beta [Halobacillus karajensis]|uniref:Phenylalanine--tRNA ligase beta subunit n=1 Tax=Halobacillus karajensis TaxID=195088 RepID=A0A024P6C5_9BACI|nr:phenylalanine--tRNA ligase subunit beta [Halobacillus karajensis]CDQ18247.1 Phenylalanine--tRNA ligase beta subunit [Halobacillus karajensis]CDQ24599.1 Phenylalanine--tRNA ligase beta subunit [Halobacillus karajensis]CDQ29154.1 Phenylalanine--tRNA ligase beta subunit [Halobacillus karajensis]
MLVSLNWLQEYVDVSEYTPEELAEIITKTGIEVESVEPVAEEIKGVVVGYVRSCEQHPNADKLNLCQVEVGEETLQIVCGAHNVAQGQKVAVATPGAVLPGNFKIKKTKLRGEESNGMICSLQELGIDEKDVPKEFSDGIFVFPEDVKVGENAVSLLNLDDIIIELGLTPNRSDALSMAGVAYEVAAAIDGTYELAEEMVQTSDKRASNYLSVVVDDEEANPYYGAFVIENIHVGPSPLWMRNRLTAAGIRPINNVVDITNYVLMEYGQPLHAFDYDRFGSQTIVTRRAKDGEKITTLDDQERVLNADHLVITNGEKAHAIAGVMGGAESEVQTDTTTVILEAAYFSPTVVREASKNHGLRSESSTRFEKGVDPNRVERAGLRACELLSKYAGGTVLEGVVSHDNLDRSEKQVAVNINTINDRLGTKISNEDMSDIFRRLQFTYEQEGDVFDVSVPTRRGDIAIFEDMLEEVARIYGYDNLPYTLPEGASQAGGLTQNQELKRKVKSYFEGAGLYETITYSLTSEDKAQMLVSPEVAEKAVSPVSLAMPMSEDHGTLRLSMLPELLSSLSYNVARKQENLAYYEVGTVFISEEEQVTKQPEEVLRASGALTGEWVTHPWQQEKKPIDFFVAKGILEGLSQQLDLSFGYEKAKLDYMHPGRTAVVSVDDETVGFIGQVHPKLQKQLGLKETYVFDINLEVLFKKYQKEEKFQAIPRHPSVSRDIALVVDEEVTSGTIEKTIADAGDPLVKDVQVFDLYQGEHLDKGKKSLAFRLLYLDPVRTLKDQEVEEAHNRILNAVKEKHQAELRG